MTIIYSSAVLEQKFKLTFYCDKDFKFFFFEYLEIFEFKSYGTSTYAL